MGGNGVSPPSGQASRVSSTTGLHDLAQAIWDNVRTRDEGAVAALAQSARRGGGARGPSRPLVVLGATNISGYGNPGRLQLIRPPQIERFDLPD